jgi:hypothetical protein
MLIEQVDVVGLKPAQTAFDHLDDIFWPAIHAYDLVAFRTRAKFGGNHYLFAPILKGPA